MSKFIINNIFNKNSEGEEGFVCWGDVWRFREARKHIAANFQLYLMALPTMSTFPVSSNLDQCFNDDNS